MIPIDDRQLLERWLKSPTTPQRVARRSRIVLLALAGFREEAIAGVVHVSRATVKLWISRFTARGAAALLHDAPGRGRHPSLDSALAHEQLKSAGLLDAGGTRSVCGERPPFLG